jgi:hypothetical protein
MRYPEKYTFKFTFLTQVFVHKYRKSQELSQPTHHHRGVDYNTIGRQPP